jgi:antitoxin ParD1/3/4
MEMKLPSAMEAFVKELIARGDFVSTDDVILNALYLLKDQADLAEIKRERLRKSLAEAAEQLERGEGIDGEVVFSRLNARIQRELGKKVS